MEGGTGPPGSGRYRTCPRRGGGHGNRAFGYVAFLQGHLHDVFAAEPVAELVGKFGNAGLVMVVAAV